jgi:pSer/pThr/pTyr-binding forkhead associated (FHA) protein
LNQAEAETLVALPPTQLPTTSVKGGDNNGDLTIALNETKGKNEKPTIQFPKELSATLTCIGGPHTGEVYLLREGITTIGRCSDNDIAFFSDNEISCHHAIVKKTFGKYIIQDKKSLNGTLVNDMEITGPYHLESGDQILVGISTIRYEWMRPTDDAATTRVLKSYE